MQFSTIENLMQQTALSTSRMYELANTDEVLRTYVLIQLLPGLDGT
jgi:hypothetical protein